jgi:hypothetical protein
MGNNFRITFDVEVNSLSSISSLASFFTLMDDDITSNPNIIGTTGSSYLLDVLPVYASANTFSGKKKLVL